MSYNFFTCEDMLQIQACVKNIKFAGNYNKK